MSENPTSGGTGSDGIHQPGPLADGGQPAENCAGCLRPSPRRGPNGECLWCLLGIDLSADGELLVDATPVVARATTRPMLYGHFELVAGADGLPVELGSGAMATTYRAHDTVLHSTVALKVINRSVAEQPRAREQFLREARAAAGLRHPNIASVTFYGEQDGECYYVMELVEGETLEARVRRDGPLSAALVLEVSVQVARALVAAEAGGVVHRDLKPSNLMFTFPHDQNGQSEQSSTVKVIDWGLAKAVIDAQALGADQTHDGFVGTPAFASPEQFARKEDRRVDTRSDIYSLGVTLWYLLCGRTPFVGGTLEAIHARQKVLPLEQLTTVRVPSCLVTVLRSMLALDLAARPQSARELLEALNSCQKQVTGKSTPRNRFGSYRLLIALGALAALVTGTVLWRRHAPGERAGIAQPPTRDPVAYELYRRVHDGRPLFQSEAEAARYYAQVGVPLLEKAVARDPKFVLAYCDLADAYDVLTQYETTTAQAEEAAKHRLRAEAVLATARRLQPDGGEMHLVQARHFRSVSHDTEQARIELDLARRQMPDTAEIEALAGEFAFNQNRWEEATRCFERASVLDPRNNDVRLYLVNLYQSLRRYDDSERVGAQIIASLAPKDAVAFRLNHTTNRLEGWADLAPLRAAIRSVIPAEQPQAAVMERYGLTLALCAHDPAAVSNLLDGTRETSFRICGVSYPRTWFVALAARLRRDEAGARDAFLAARQEIERIAQVNAADGRTLSLLAMIDAGLGNKDQAVREALHACELCPVETAGDVAPIVSCNLAVVYAWTGQTDLACAVLEEWIKRPAGFNLPGQPTYGDFQLNPLWDPLRDEPRFVALVARLAPPAVR